MVDEDLIVAFVTDSNYFPYVLFQCTQIWKIKSEQKIFVLLDSPQSPTSEWQSFLCDHPHLQIEAVHESDIPKELKSERHVSRTTYLKLLLPQYLVKYNKKVLYLDPDILILRNPFKLIEKIPYPDHMGAVRIHDEEGIHLKNFKGPYFNAGVLVFNLESSMVVRLPSVLSDNHPKTFKYQDQDLLNLVFENKWTEISNKFNYFPYKFLNLRKAIPVIIHFIGADKPWRSRQPTVYHLIWVLRWNRFLRSNNLSEFQMRLSGKQRIFPIFWFPGGRLLLKITSHFYAKK